MKSLFLKVLLCLKSRKLIFLKFLFLIFSLTAIIYAVVLLSGCRTGLLQFLFKPALFIIKISFIFLSKLLVKTPGFIFPPVLLYLTASLVSCKRSSRYLSFLTLFSLYVIYFFKIIIPPSLFSFDALFRIPDIFITILQIYIFTALIIPEYFINYLGGIIFIMKGIMFVILPDLPSRLDDLGMIFALFMFIFFYINTIVVITRFAGQICYRFDSGDFLRKTWIRLKRDEKEGQ